MITASLTAYLPIDRRLALMQGQALPDRAIGAALFADISGFTPLTNSLARELGPQRGAEELSRQLNRIYTALIAEVDHYGGSVISFSGDAITCWFTANEPLQGAEPPSPASDRAVACALAMQQIMAGFAAVQTPAGTTVHLAIKVAVAAGPVRRFVVGDPKIQLIDVLAGTTLDRLNAAEHAAQRGEVVVTADVVVRLRSRPQVLAWRPSEDSAQGFAVIGGLTTPVSPAPWPAISARHIDPEQLRPWLLPPVYNRLLAGQGQFLAELRPALALFVFFSGIDYDHDPEAGAKLDDYISWAQRIVARYEGALLQLTIGDKGSYFYCAFGAPLAHEDDAVRAARAALLLRTPPFEIDYIQVTQIGISQGRLSTGAYGGDTRRTYGVLGEDVNMAARLMQAAGPGQILVNQTAQVAAGDRFTWEALPPLMVKGRSEPLTAFRLISARERRPLHLQASLYGLPLVGRTAELNRIAELLQIAQNGQGQIVSITGEAGLGKSRLVMECMRLASDGGMTIFSGEAPSYGTNDSYVAWEGVWQTFFGIDRSTPPETQIADLESALAAIDPELLPRLPLLGLPLNLSIPDNELTRSLDTRLRKISLEALLVACLRARATAGPIMFVLEDGHWMDPLSHDLLELLGRAIFDLPVVFVVAFRPPELEYLRSPRITALPHCTVLNLADLSAEESAELVQLKQIHLDMPLELPPEVVAWVVGRTQGNPFFIEEFLNYLHNRNLAPQTVQELEDLDLPTSLYSLVLSRIDQLSERQKTTLKVASVIGRIFRAAWLWGVHPELGQPQQVFADLEVLNRLELALIDQPEPESVYLFKHIMTHGVAYESLPFETRSWLHEQVATYIERAYANSREQFVDLLAYHYDRSRNDAKKREYLKLAGKAAQAAYANATAIDYYRRLLKLLPDHEQGAVCFRLGQVLELTGEWAEAAEHYQRALALADAGADMRAAIECRRAIGWLYRKQANYAEARSWLEQARAGFGILRESAGMIQTLTDIGEVYRLQGDFAQAGRYYGESLELASVTERAPEVLAARADALKGAGTLAALQGDLEPARARYEESLAIRRELGDRPGIAALLNNLSILARFRGDTAAAWALNEESLSAFRAIGDRWSMGQALNNLGMVAIDAGNHIAAQRYLRESVEVRRTLGDTWGIANSLNSLASLLIRAQEYGEAETLLHESLTLNMHLGDRLAAASCLEDYAALAAIDGRARRALLLAGAAAGLRAELGAQLAQADQAALDARLDPARAALGAEAQPIWDSGQGLNLEQAVALALEQTHSPA